MFPSRLTHCLFWHRQLAHAEAAKTGVGVSIEAQQVFDALAKTMPCQWKQQSIVVLNEASDDCIESLPFSAYHDATGCIVLVQVEVMPPYGLDNCTTEHASDTTTLARVKKVVSTCVKLCMLQHLALTHAFLCT